MKVVCPNCKHLFETINKSGRRKCALCKKVIGRHHKWFFRNDGRIQHRHCKSPMEYIIK